MKLLIYDLGILRLIFFVAEKSAKDIILGLKKEHPAPPPRITNLKMGQMKPILCLIREIIVACKSYCVVAFRQL